MSNRKKRGTKNPPSSDRLSRDARGRRIESHEEWYRRVDLREEELVTERRQRVRTIAEQFKESR